MVLEISLFIIVSLVLTSAAALALRKRVTRLASCLDIVRKYPQTSEIKKKSMPSLPTSIEEDSKCTVSLTTSKSTPEPLNETEADNGYERRRIIAQMMNTIINNIVTPDTTPKRDHPA